jgi:hypothetical protein
LAFIGNACTSECEYQQYQQCGSGFTAEDEALFNSEVPTDPVQSLSPDEAQQVYQQSGSAIDPAKQGSSSSAAWYFYSTTCYTGFAIAFAFLSTCLF